MTTIEYPRSRWDEQRAEFRAAARRARVKGYVVYTVVGIVVLGAGLVMSSGPNEVVAALLLGLVVAMIAGCVTVSLRRKRAQRSAVHDLREALSASGHAVTADQAGILLGLACCWLSDHRYLEADLSEADLVVLRVIDPPREVLASGMFASAGGGGGGGGDGGGGC